MQNILIKIFLIVEIIFFCYFYFLGPYSYKLLKTLKSENIVLNNSLEKINNEIEQLKQVYNEMQEDDFYKEKIARELLQLSYKDEEIYIYNNE